MSVLIKMVMPQNCRECRLVEIVNRHGRERYICIAHLNEITNLKERLETCPLEELPDHGDLVDVDELMKTAREMAEYWETEYELPRILQNAPVIIPAERSEDGET